MEENKRQLCVFQEAVHKQEPWLWWAFAADYAAHCTMANGRFNDRACARQQAEAAGLDFAAIETCMADSSKDEAHPLLEACSPGPLGLGSCPYTVAKQPGLHQLWDPMRQRRCRAGVGETQSGRNCGLPELAVYISGPGNPTVC